jgi:cytochrome o ubiquinol oxidase subunit 1
MAGLTYWFPRFSGFRLKEKLGKYAAICWIVGFATAFIPLYILGLMGATRRLDHYDASLGWQPLFIVAAIGVGIIGIGITLQVIQLLASVLLRETSVDKTGDPWNGRTLEWSIAQPVPVYNYARIPVVSERDAFWAEKQSKDTNINRAKYEDIILPKNTPFPLIIAGFAFLTGFCIIWHIYWLALIGLLGVITSIIIRTSDENTEYVITAEQVKKMEAGRRELNV